MNKKLFLTGALVSALLTSFLATAADKKVDISKLPPPSDKSGVTYAADIKPIFEKSCIKCHGTEKQKGKLRLDTLEATLKGGEDGKVIMPGKSADSMLVHNVARLSGVERDHHLITRNPGIIEREEIIARVHPFNERRAGTLDPNPSNQTALSIEQTNRLNVIVRQQARTIWRPLRRLEPSVDGSDSCLVKIN